ncbi:MAG: carboxypeptidase regulatory-like domain-containing protein, partial [Thermoguttaceae bacterium]|nr:carboxypeptidase regulatory-like domain-containing protein [Thermoguttaceae bacterium]
MKSRAKNRRNADARRLRFETLETRRLLAVDLAPTNPEFAELLSEASAVEIAETNATDQVAPIETADWFVLSPTLDATPQEQELLERINRFRADPAGELERIFSSITETKLTAYNSLVNDALSLYQYPKNSIETFLKEWAALESAPPLAVNSALDVAAATHNRAMIARNDVSHQTSGEKSLADRVVDAGFESGASNADGSFALGENVGGSFAASGNFSVASFIFEAFAVDWGVPTHSHRDAFMNAAFTEIGVSISTTKKDVGPNVATIDFGTSVLGARTDGAYLLGSVFDDADRDLFYDAGEGLGGATLTIERLDGSETPQKKVEITSANAGGYQIFLLNGTYRVTVEGEGFASPVTKTVSINDGVNAKLDFRTSDAGAAPPIVDLNGVEADGTDFSAVFVEGAVDSAEVLAASKLTIADADSAFLYGAKIEFANRPDGVDESLDASIAGTNLRASFDEQGGVVTLSGVGTLEEYEDAIASLTYFNAKDFCNLTDRVVTISVFDGVYWSDAAELTIAVKPTNLPNMTVQEAFVYEGDEGSTVATFVVELDAPARLDVSFNYRVALGGTAVESEAFVVPVGDPKVIAQGETTATIEFYVLGNYDALKPEGLAAVEGGYENPATDFFLEIVDLENAYLTNENALVKGTIYDDDSPIILGKVDEYEFAGTLDSDGGKRRYVFTVTPETSGYFAWKADLADSPNGLAISVRPGALEAEPLELSEATESGQRAQWFADPAVEYWVVVESAADFNAVAAKLLPIDENNVALLDPIFDAATEELLKVFWDDAWLE